jgi:Zn-dependent peptidase ImmA (M78 family)
MKVLAPYGISVLVTCNEEPLAGYLYANNRFGAIFVRQDDPVVRRRFSVAHELGHYLLHFRPLLLKVDHEGVPLLDEVDDSIGAAQAEGEPSQAPLARAQDISERLPPYAQLEDEADSFAAYLLMPEDVVRALAARLGHRCKGEDLVWRLASDLLVSQAAMRWRLRALGLLAGRAGEVA